MARNGSTDCAAALGFSRFAAPAPIRHNFCAFDVLAGISLHWPGEHSISGQRTRRLYAYIQWAAEVKVCLVRLGVSTEERSMLSLYAFSRDVSAVSMRLRSLSSNVCQSGTWS
jgi:hypothetical protein